MTAFSMPMESKRAIHDIRRFHALVIELAGVPLDNHGDGLDAIGAQLHGRVAECGYGIGRGVMSGTAGHWSGKHWGGGQRSQSGSGETGYVMVALADETLIRLIDWPGRERWPDKLLEERIYGTRVAGDRVFALAESLHHRRDSERIGLAAAIHLALLMGFRGRYADDEPPGLIDGLLDELHPIAFGPRSDVHTALSGLDACSMGEALKPTPVKKLPALRPWLMGSLAICLGYLGASHLLWQNAVDETMTRAIAIHEQLD